MGGSMTRGWLLLAALVFQVPALAERLDDSLSTQQQYDADLVWKEKYNTENLDRFEVVQSPSDIIDPGLSFFGHEQDAIY